MPVKFELKPEEQGVRQYKLRVRPFEGEIDRRDNEKTAKVEIIDRRTKVLLIAGGPMRDFIFLRNQLFRDKEVISDVWLQSGKPGISQEAHEILLQVPRNRGRAVRVRRDRRLRSRLGAARRAAGETAGALGGGKGGRPDRRRRPGLHAAVVQPPPRRSADRHDQGALSRSRFIIRARPRSAWAASAPRKPGRSQFTRDGQEAEFLWLDENAAASEQAWDQFEGVCGYYAVKDSKAGARVYARFGDPDTAIDNVQPIYMAGQFYGSGRVFFMASGEMWRVRAVDDTYFEQFYTKLIRWAAEGRLLARFQPRRAAGG